MYTNANMKQRVGVFIHCRNLTSLGWERLIWGSPEDDQLGDIPTLMQVICQQKLHGTHPMIVIGEGPSQKDGLLEGSYTKRYALEHVKDLRLFSRLQPYYEIFGDGFSDHITSMIDTIQVTAPIQNTREETLHAARLFRDKGVSVVYEIAAATHASRCIKEQTVARQEGVIPSWQRWYTTSTDISYAQTKPSDVVVIEPLHRLDQGSLEQGTELAKSMNAYYSLADSDKKQFVQMVTEFYTARKP